MLSGAQKLPRGGFHQQTHEVTAFTWGVFAESKWRRLQALGGGSPCSHCSVVPRDRRLGVAVACPLGPSPRSGACREAKGSSPGPEARARPPQAACLCRSPAGGHGLEDALSPPGASVPPSAKRQMRCVASRSCSVGSPACWRASAWCSVTVSCSSFVSLGVGGNCPRSPGGRESFPAGVPAAAHQADGVKSQAGAGSQTTGQPSTWPRECGAEGGWPCPLGSPARWEQSPAGPFFWFSRDSEIPARGR